MLDLKAIKTFGLVERGLEIEKMYIVLLNAVVCLLLNGCLNVQCAAALDDFDNQGDDSGKEQQLLMY